MAQTWPSHWPKLNKIETFKPKAPFVRTPFTSGRARNRRAFTAVPVPFDGAVTFLCADDAAEFAPWFKDTLADGSKPFFVDVYSSAGLTTEIVQFTGMYTEEIISTDVIRFKMPLEILTRPIAGAAPPIDTISAAYVASELDAINGEVI